MNGRTAAVLDDEQATEKQMALARAYNDAISALTVLRDRHVVLVGRFIVIPARKAAAATAAAAFSAAREGIDKVDERGGGVKGSAGTEVIGFLKGMRAETEGCLLGEGTVDLMV